MVSQPQEISPPGISTRRLVILWLVIFVLALGQRLFFVNLQPQLPVIWDARLYVCAAVGILGYLNGEEPYASKSTTSEDFNRQYQHHIQGEQIEWLYYSPPTLTQAQKYLFYSGPVYPGIMAAVFAFTWDNDFQAVRWFNSVIDAFGVLFIALAAYFICRRISAAILAAVLQLLYFPLAVTCGILGLETITSFFIATLLLLIVLYDQHHNRWLMAGAGIVGGLLFLTKPTASFLTAPILLYLGFRHGLTNRRFIQSAIYYLVAFVLLVTPWIIFVSGYYGTPAIRDPEYSEANFRSSSSIEFEGYDLDLSEPDFWTYSVAGQIAKDPLGYVNLLSKKLIRLWWQPHDEFHQGPWQYEVWYHRLLMLIVLFGVVILMASKAKGWVFPLFVLLYYTAIHIIMHAVARYNFNALPALFLLLTVVIISAGGISSQWHSLKKRIITIGSALGIVILFLLLADQTSWIVAKVGTPIALAATLLIIVILSLWFSRVWLRERRALIRWTGALIPAFILSITAVTGLTRPGVNEGYAAGGEGRLLETEIVLPAGFRAAVDDKIRLVCDLTTDPLQNSRVGLEINGHDFSFDDGQPPVDRDFYVKGTYSAFESLMHLDRRRMRWYRSIMLAPDLFNTLVSNSGRMHISLSGDGLRIFGDCWDQPSQSVPIPSFRHNSIERFKELEDRRVYQTYRFSSLSARSVIREIDGRLIDNLSFQSGRQTGRFRVYLIIARNDFSTLYF